MTVPTVEFVASNQGGFAVITFESQDHDLVEQILDSLPEARAEMYDLRAWVHVESKADFRHIQKYFIDCFDQMAKVEVL